MSGTRKAATSSMYINLLHFCCSICNDPAEERQTLSSSVSLNPESLQHFTMALSKFIFICLWFFGGFMGVWLMCRVPLIKCFSAWSSPLQAFSATSLFVFRHLILKWSRSVVHVQLRSNRALALTNFLRSKRLKVETNFTDTLKCSVICSAVQCSNLSLLSGCFILNAALLFSLKK